MVKVYEEVISVVEDEMVTSVEEDDLITGVDEDGIWSWKVMMYEPPIRRM